MKQKHIKKIIIFLIIIVIIAIFLGIQEIQNSFVFKEDGMIHDASEDIIGNLKEIEDYEERFEQVNAALKYNMITEEQAKSILEN